MWLLRFAPSTTSSPGPWRQWLPPLGECVPCPGNSRGDVAGIAFDIEDRASRKAYLGHSIVLVDLDVDRAKQAALPFLAGCLPALHFGPRIRRKMILAARAAAVTDPPFPGTGTFHALILNYPGEAVSRCQVAAVGPSQCGERVGRDLAAAVG